MHPEAASGKCRGSINRAHTIQRTGGLSRIARNGRVYHFRPDPVQLARNDGILKPTLVGVKDACTFTGFCEFHDSATFAPIEKTPLRFIPEHMFLLAYRAVCLELHAKLGTASYVCQMRDIDKGRSLQEQIPIQNVLSTFELATNAGLKDIQACKNKFDHILETRAFTGVDFFALHLNKCSEVLCCTGITPHRDFRGRTLQEFGDLNDTLEILTLSIVPTDSGGAVVLAWLRETDSPSERFVRSFLGLPDEQKPNALLRFVFCSTDNIAMSPNWWEGLSSKNRHRLQDYLFRACSFDNGCPDHKDDGLNVVDWNIDDQFSSLAI